MATSENTKQADRSTRREFGKKLVAITLPLGLPLGQMSEAAGPDPKPLEAPGASRATIDALTEIARIRYGKQLNKDQLQKIRGSIARSIYAAERLHEVKLANSDEPACRFSARMP